MTVSLSMGVSHGRRGRESPGFTSPGGLVPTCEEILRAIPDAVWTTGPDGLVVEFNPGASRLLGYEPEQVREAPISLLFVERAGFDKRLERALAGEPQTGMEFEGVRADGSRIPLSVSLAPIRSADGGVLGAVGTARDNTRPKAIERELTRRSITDRLTGLYNQTYFFESLETEKERADRLDHALSLVLLDLDGFKAINDRHGHVEGDRVLEEIAAVLFESVRKGVDSAFRYGGDEFALLCPGLSDRAALEFAERLRARIEAKNLSGVRASIGVCEYRDHDRTIQLVKEADRAMYESKRAGGNRVTLVGREGRDPPSRVRRDPAGDASCSS